MSIDVVVAAIEGVSRVAGNSSDITLSLADDEFVHVTSSY